MSNLSLELDQMLQCVDQDTAQALERAVRTALARAAGTQVQRPSEGLATDTLGYPLGYFESTAGSFADESFDPPRELPMQRRESW